MNNKMVATRRPRLGWVVDVQRDFMEPQGRLYVHNLFDSNDRGAMLARDTIVRTVGWMRRQCDALVFTGDWHAYGDREIDIESPDATRGTYPPHCMGRSPDEDERRGALLIHEIDPGSEAVVLDHDASDRDAERVAREIVAARRPGFVQKREFSVFDGNPATEALLAALGSELGQRPDILLCGVATDVCVRHAVEGFLDREFSVTIVRDATWGLGLLSNRETWEQWASRGAAINTIEELISQIA